MFMAMPPDTRRGTAFDAMRHFTFKTFALTLFLSVVVELLFYLVCVFCGSSENQPNWVTQAFKGFHYPAVFLVFGWLDPESGVLWRAILFALILFSVAVLQWWLIILAAILMFRHFRTRNDNAS